MVTFFYVPQLIVPFQILLTQLSYLEDNSFFIDSYSLMEKYIFLIEKYKFFTFEMGLDLDNLSIISSLLTLDEDEIIIEEKKGAIYAIIQTQEAVNEHYNNNKMVNNRFQFECFLSNLFTTNFKKEDKQDAIYINILNGRLIWGSTIHVCANISLFFFLLGHILLLMVLGRFNIQESH
ncbi:hypothetical protein ACJX0J_009165 [Zea mays]